jgi:hypothetical protein
MFRWPAADLGGRVVLDIGAGGTGTDAEVFGEPDPAARDGAAAAVAPADELGSDHASTYDHPNARALDVVPLEAIREQAVDVPPDVSCLD